LRENSANLTVEMAVRLHASLEADGIARTAQEVAAELVPSAETRIFGLATDDAPRLSRLGGEDTRTFAPPDFGGAPLVVDARPVDGEAAWLRGRVLLAIPLVFEGRLIGVLEVAAAAVLGPEEMSRLRGLADILVGALHNGQTFERTKRLTFTDDLTALYNSRFMALYLDREVKRCKRTRTSLSLLFMDLDGFKSVNDTHGHLAGSRTLVEVGAALEKTVRDADVIIRYGGDEFVILFPETPLSGGLVIAERVRQVIENTRFLESMNIDARVSASIGIAAYPESADDVRGLIASADRAMYEAKSLGKNRVVAANVPSPQVS
jgi:diguanylate cyclase (GGDEF)-like protein